MKANKYKGMARKGCFKRTHTIQIKNAASYCGEKITKTFILGRSFNKRGFITLAEKVYEQLNTPGYFAFMKCFAKKNNSAFAD